MEKSGLCNDKTGFEALLAESQSRLQLIHPNLLTFLGIDFADS